MSTSRKKLLVAMHLLLVAMHLLLVQQCVRCFRCLRLIVELPRVGTG